MIIFYAWSDHMNWFIFICQWILSFNAFSKSFDSIPYKTLNVSRISYGYCKCSKTLSRSHAHLFVTFNYFKLPLFMPSYGVDHLFSKCIFPMMYMYLVFNLLYEVVQRGYTLYYKTSRISCRFQLPEIYWGITYL